MIEIYTDGGCSGNPGPGGWAYLIIKNEELEKRNVEGENRASVIIAENWGAEKSTTNNKMELTAVIAALEALVPVKGEKINVYTDSQYVQKGMTLWLEEWKKKGWKTSGRAPVKNQDLWQRLDALAKGFEVNWIWVKGHAGDKYNERCDELTKKAISSL